jgi:predicted GNAT superfamily acetyltransferase
MILTVSLRFRQLTGPAELADASRLLVEVFGSDGDAIPGDLLTAIASAGGFVGGGLLDGELVAVAVGFGEVPAPGADGPRALHSHVAAVSSAARGLRVGQRLKWYQRDWALERGIRVIHWTFDPLVRRNAVLNLNRLGGVADSYHQNLYGAIPDALNRGMESDRLLVRWELDSPRVLAARDRAEAAPGDDDGAPGVIDTPVDIEALVATDPAAARDWRRDQRRAFGSLAPGWTVTGIDPDGRYRVENS